MVTNNLKKKKRLAIVGFGVVGQRRYELLQARDDVIVVAVSDKNRSVLEDRDPNIKLFLSYKEIETCEVDGVFICVPNYLAAEATTFFITRNIAVFCEKPPSKSLAELNDVIARKRSTNCLMYGFNHRHHFSVMRAKEVIDSGRLGRIVAINGVYGKSKILTYDKTKWRASHALAGGGILLDQGIHMVDLMLFFHGGFDEVKSFISNSRWQYDVEDNVAAIMKDSNGTIAVLHSSATLWEHTFRLFISLEHGSVELKGILSGSKSYGQEQIRIISSNTIDELDIPKIEQYQYETDPSWGLEIEIFMNCLNGVMGPRGLGYAQSSVDAALGAMRLIERIYSADVEWNTKFRVN